MSPDDRPTVSIGSAFWHSKRGGDFSSKLAQEHRPTIRNGRHGNHSSTNEGKQRIQQQGPQSFTGMSCHLLSFIHYSHTIGYFRPGDVGTDTHLYRERRSHINPLTTDDNPDT